MEWEIEESRQQSRSNRSNLTENNEDEEVIFGYLAEASTEF